MRQQIIFQPILQGLEVSGRNIIRLSNFAFLPPMDDIKKAKNLKNVEGIIVGKAIYDGDIQLEELVKEDA